MVAGGAPSARVFATRGLDVRKEPDSAERYANKIFSQIEAKEKKLRPIEDGHSNLHYENDSPL